ncbi:MAG: tRNA pseudouridine(38-40) synthase TruA [Pseudomonadota bacterium]
MVDHHPRFSPEPFPAEGRVACRVEYDGSAYKGWQLQPEASAPTVQGELERALSGVADRQVRVHCAGRTDAGVHGHAQIVHFDPGVSRSAKSWVMGTNGQLPRDIRVHWAERVPQTFHARYSALSRCYRYLIANTAVRPAVLARQLSWHRHPLDAERMHEAAQHLLGEQDFSAFRASTCQSSSPMRHVSEVKVSRADSVVVIEISANAFLHHMVRNIAGSLMAVGSGRQEPEWIVALLASRDRRLAADTAPADGLYLVDVVYPAEFGLPPTPKGLLDGMLQR